MRKLLLLASVALLAALPARASFLPAVSILPGHLASLPSAGIIAGNTYQLVMPAGSALYGGFIYNASSATIYVDYVSSGLAAGGTTLLSGALPVGAGQYVPILPTGAAVYVYGAAGGSFQGAASALGVFTLVGTPIPSGTIGSSYAGVPITPITYTAATTPDYSTFTPVTAGSQPDINPANTAAFTLAFQDSFTALSAYNPTTGAGTWLEGSPNDINSETEFYPTAAQIATVGSSPFAINSNGLAINLSPLNSGYASDVQNSNQKWQSGRLDTSLIPGFYAESGLLYLETVAQVSPNASSWPAFWALASDAQYPLEYDTMEVFGAPQTSYDQTIHYQAPAGGGNNTKVARVYTSGGANLSSSFHVYGLLVNWKTQTTSAYFDHHFVGSNTFSTDPQGFDKEVYLILDQATGGSVASPPSGTTFPLTYQVKQVSVYYGVNSALPAAVSGTQSETTAFLNALTTQPSATWTAAFNTMIVTAKNLGFFTAPYKPAHWWMFAGDTQDASLIDIMNPTGAKLTASGTALTWTKDKGYTGNNDAGYLETGINLSSIDETNYGLGAWILATAPDTYSGNIITTTASGNDLQLSSYNNNTVTANLGFQYGAYGYTAPDTNLGWFGVATFKDSGSAYVDRVCLMGGYGNGVTNFATSGATALPSSTVHLMAGTDAAATVLLGNQWHQPRQKLFRDQVLHPFLLAIGAVSQ